MHNLQYEADILLYHPGKLTWDTTETADTKIYGGCITGGGNGGVFVAKINTFGTFVMNGGNIVGNSGGEAGGVWVSGSFVMNGGNIVGNSGTAGGVMIINESTATFTMSGGNITGNIGSDTGGVYVVGSSTNTFNVSGSPVIKDNTKGDDYSNVSLMGSKCITVTDTLRAPAEIWISNPVIPGSGDGTPFVQKAPSYEGDLEYNAPYFHPDAGFAGAKVGTEEGKTDKLVWDTNPALIEYAGIEYNGNSEDLAKYILLCPLFKGNSTTYEDRVLKLGDNVTLESSTLKILAPMTHGETPFTINLNGKTLQRKEDVDQFNVITIMPGAELVVNDSGENGTITNGAAYDEGRGVYSGGGVSVDGGKFTLNGGIITGNTAAQNGGGVSVCDGEFTMTGGKISNNSATKNGGGVEIWGSKFTMTGGTIGGDDDADKNTALQWGGGVYVHSHAAATPGIMGIFNMTGGNITGNSATSYGGGVYVLSETGSTITYPCIFAMSDGTITKNIASSGGGVYVDGTFTMTGGTIGDSTHDDDGNTADNSGGGIYIGSLGTFDMSNDAIIAKNIASSGGGGVYNDGRFLMSGGSITGNSATSYGGGLYLSGGDGEAEITGGNITDNSALLVGGVMVMSGKFTMKGGSITGNHASIEGMPDMGIPNLYSAGLICNSMTDPAVVSDSATVKDNKVIDASGKETISNTSVFNIIGETEEEPFDIMTLELEGTLKGEIHISHVYKVTLNKEGDPSGYEEIELKGNNPFGTAASGAKGANNFKADGTSLVGSLTDGKLLWTGASPEPEPTVYYTVTFDSAGGSAVSPQTVAEGSTASKPANPEREGHSFAKWLKDGAEYDFSTPVYSDITLTAKWNTKAPETEEEIDELIDELQDSDKEVTVPVNNLTFARMLLQKAKDAGVKDKISIDPTAGDKDALMELIYAAEQGDYSPINLETAEDTRDKVGELITDETVPKKDIALPVKADGSNINVVLEVIEEYAAVTGPVSVPVPDAVRVPKGTEIEPSTPTENIVKTLLIKAADSATADNVHLILTEQNKEAVSEITKELDGLIVKVTEDNHDAISFLVDECEAVITFTVDSEADKNFIKTFAKDHDEILVEVTGYNEDLIEDLLFYDEIPLTLKAAENGSNIETILQMEDEFQDLVDVHTPSKIILSDDVTMKITGEEKNTQTLQRLLKAAIAGADTATGLVTLDTGSEERNLRLVVEELLGAKGVNASIIKEFDYTHQPDIEEIVPVIMAPADGHAYPGYSTNIKPEAEKYVNSVELYDAENAASILVTKLDTHVLGEKTKTIPQEIPASIGYTSQSVYTVFQTYGTAADEEKPVTVEFVVNSKPGYGNGTENYYLKYLNPETNTWERSHITMTGKPEKVEGTENTWVYTFNLENPGVYAFVYEEKVRNTTKGTSVWAVETPEPTVTPTQTPTAEPTQGQGIPTIKPTTQIPTGKSPAPLFGLLAGLGCAAVIFGLRRR